jgi:hypothetical protein
MISCIGCSVSSGLARDHWGPGPWLGLPFWSGDRAMDAHRMNVAVLAARQLRQKWPELIAGGIFGVLAVIVGIIFWVSWHGMMWF